MNMINNQQVNYSLGLDVGQSNGLPTASSDTGSYAAVHLLGINY